MVMEFDVNALQLLEQEEPESGAWPEPTRCSCCSTF
ncbi:ALQxL family class IV lanthipeptide [Streptomyces sp. NPDC004232]